ncbi:uncharacterized protein LOC134708212 [Mytilus trossulus]|uniref:uncharacterized protein LOC134708212 n=1 Tax=Mytilus trossulus TaxID=6551 RepID=UPI003006637F
MSTDNSLSVHFYEYLCKKIGSKEDVRVRRLEYVISDLCYTAMPKLSSGSKGEGLDLKGSDYDVMYIASLFTVYESERDAVFPFYRIPLVMDTEDTPPCFTQLRHPDYYTFISKSIKQILQKTCIMNKLSNELYLSYFQSITNGHPYCSKIHGPCLSDQDDLYDFAICLKCDKWVTQAKPWVSRPRTTWPTPELITKIAYCGVLFVPIGCKGSTNENLEWRMSFSVAEKCLIFSFSHTQLLVYALLKILLKEIVDKHQDVKGLLCSYFLKTLMFWISEESEPSIWRPDNIIPCFMACLQRLIYCVEYSTLLHYFIPDNNLFYLRFNSDNKLKLTNILKNSYEQGIHCFIHSETLYDCNRLPIVINISKKNTYSMHDHKISSMENYHVTLLKNLLYHSRTSLSRGIFTISLSQAYQLITETLQQRPNSNNKRQYYKYKHKLSHLLIGTQSDAVSGWLLLASFFYFHKNYLTSLSILQFVLIEKLTVAHISLGHSNGVNPIQESVMDKLKQKRLHTVLKTQTYFSVHFNSKSLYVPQELQMDVTDHPIIINPEVFGPFLTFLCYYHQGDITSCRKYLYMLHQTIILNMTFYMEVLHIDSLICLGIAYQMIGGTIKAKDCFKLAVVWDEFNQTSAVKRLSSLC